jgi:hypothetical protein
LDPRQLGAALNNTIQDLQGARNQLGPAGRNNPGIGEAIQNLNEAITAAQNGNQGLTGASLAEIEKMINQVLTPLREAEIDLSKTLQSLVEKDKIRAAMEDDIPSANRNEVKAYLELIGKGK